MLMELLRQHLPGSRITKVGGSKADSGGRFHDYFGILPAGADIFRHPSQEPSIHLNYWLAKISQRSRRERRLSERAPDVKLAFTKQGKRQAFYCLGCLML
jgi:hypothetical protein